MKLLNVNENEKMYPILLEIVNNILNSNDSKYVEEISIAPECIMAGGHITHNRIHIFVETSLEFVNTDLYAVLDDFEYKYEKQFHFIGSVEPNYVERNRDVIPLYMS